MIRSANNGDIPQIIQLIHETYRDYGDSICLDGADRDLTDIEKTYLKPGGRFWVYEKNDAICGTVAVIPGRDGHSAVLKRLYLKKKHHGRGIGDELLQTALDWADQRGYGQMVFWSDTRFKRGHRFYAKHGFIRGKAREMNDGNMPYTEYYFEKKLGVSSSP